MRKSDKFGEAVVTGVRTAFPKSNTGARRVLEEMLPAQGVSNQNGVSAGKEKDSQEEQLPEVWAYLGILVQVSSPPPF